MAIDETKLAFTSTSRYLRVHLKDTIDVTTTASFGTTVSVDHNLGYTPFVRLYTDYPDLAGIRRTELFAQGSVYIIEVEITTTQLKIGVTNDVDFGDTTAVPFYYRIYAEPQE